MQGQGLTELLTREESFFHNGAPPLVRFRASLVVLSVLIQILLC
jgi:hypothetical protein